MNKNDVDVLSRALAQVLINAVDAGDKEGGYEGLWKYGPQRYAQGVKAPTGTPTAQYAHGPGGLFSSLGIDGVVVSTHMTPRDLDGLLPVYPTVFMNPIYPMLMGFREDLGNEPNGVCEDCLGGEIQGCELTAQFGHVCRGSDEIHATRQVQMINRGETSPLALLGDILGPGSVTRMPNTPTEWLEVVTKAEMVKIAVFIQRKLMRMTWNGNPANNMPGGGYREFPGLEMLVRTGYVDLTTGTTCEGADSFIMNWGWQDIAATQANGYDIVGYLSAMEWYVMHNVTRMGFDPTRHVLCMSPGMWQELSAIWPCRYWTNKCTGTATAVANGLSINVGGEEQIMMRDRMRQSLTLEINGHTYPVILCDGMTEFHGNPGLPNFNANVPNGSYGGSIFFLPLSVRDGVKSLYWETLDYSKADVVISDSRSNQNFWTDGGRIFWTVDRLRGCFKMNAEMDMRLVLKTPHLAARLDGIVYSPLVHLRSPFDKLDATHADPYFVKGGVAERVNPADSWYTPWNAAGPGWPTRGQ